MNWRALGFTQRRPTSPGVYLFGDDRSPNRVEPWTVGRFYYFAGSFSNAYENVESAAHWRINSVDGLSFAWRKGMWIKGPIGPDWQAREGGK